MVILTKALPLLFPPPPPPPPAVFGRPLQEPNASATINERRRKDLLDFIEHPKSDEKTAPTQSEVDKFDLSLESNAKREVVGLLKLSTMPNY